MANIGLRLALWAPIAQENEHALPTYGDIITIGKAISAKTSWDRSEATLYADDMVAENENTTPTGTLELNVDQIRDEALTAMLGMQEVTETGGAKSYALTTDSAPNGGVAYIRHGKKNNVAFYVAYVVHKVKFGYPDEEATTQGDSVEYQTDTISGKIMSVDNGNKHELFRRSSDFTTFADAEAWARKMLGEASNG